MVNSDGIPVIDLFAGAGGLGIGAALAGGDVRVSLELDARACETLRLNADPSSHLVVEADVATLGGVKLRELARLSKSDPVIVVGGAPCQPFSKAAYWTDPGDDSRYRRARTRGEQALKPRPILEARPDERRTLVEEFWRVVEESRADGFVFENVPSIAHPRNRPVLDGLVAAAENAGYSTTVVKANAVAYGVPQARERVFVLGSRRAAPLLPRATHNLIGEDRLDLAQPVTAGVALRGLDAPQFFEPEEVVAGRWADHLHSVPPGWNYKAHTAWAGHPNPTFETETRFWNFLLKLSPDRPSWTLAATPGPWTGPFHWNSRRLRTVEMAALQSFPRDYKFAGPRRERVRQIGNAVPPLLASRMVKSVLSSVEALDAAA
jgi:DNA (cytosine-5)-methyltransferase 1